MLSWGRVCRFERDPTVTVREKMTKIAKLLVINELFEKYDSMLYFYFIQKLWR